MVEWRLSLNYPDNFDDYNLEDQQLLIGVPDSQDNSGKMLLATVLGGVDLAIVRCKQYFTLQQLSLVIKTWYNNGTNPYALEK